MGPSEKNKARNALGFHKETIRFDWKSFDTVKVEIAERKDFEDLIRKCKRRVDLGLRR